MLFNSVQFIYFFLAAIVACAVTPIKVRWAILLGLSYYFYMSWHAASAYLILITTMVSYGAAIQIERSNTSRRKRAFLAASIIASLSILFFYKYFDFLASTVNSLFGMTGDVSVPLFNLLLPVGISFYTFQTLSYTVDVYRGSIKSEKHFGRYALFVSFFPQLVAGPIERSSSLLPQFRTRKGLLFDNFVIGTKYMIVGFFMKLVVADRLALYVDAVYNNVSAHGGWSIALATFFFSFQIFCDFAGYSTIALGVAKCFGFDLMVNFQRPYFATSMTDFWRRWHVSLSTWFKDYVYIPLGGNRVKLHVKYFNLFLTFLVSGIWHGASWTFVLWGALHGLLLIVENLFGWNKATGSGIRVLRSLIVFLVISFTWIFFRSNSVSDAFLLITRLTDFSSPFYADYKTFFYGGLGIVVLIMIEYLIERNPSGFITNSELDFKGVCFFAILAIMTLSIAVFDGGQFIYFQF